MLAMIQSCWNAHILLIIGGVMNRWNSLENCSTYLLKLNRPIVSVVCCCLTNHSNQQRCIISPRSVGYWLICWPHSLMLPWSAGSWWGLCSKVLHTGGDLSWHSCAFPWVFYPRLGITWWLQGSKGQGLKLQDLLKAGRCTKSLLSHSNHRDESCD